MGNFVVSALKVINCTDCAKYVCNACKAVSYTHLTLPTILLV